METHDPLLECVAPVLAAVPGVVAIALGGSRARGNAHAASDYDLGLYFSESAGLDVARLLTAVQRLVDDPRVAAVTEVGGWGPWIVGGGWLTIAGQKVDLLYRPIEAVEKVIRDCRNGRITMDYQPGHPHGFCSAIWMGEAALCRPLSDPKSVVAGLKARTVPYPEKLGEALIRRFRSEALFSIQNAQTAVARGDQNYIAGCAFRSFSCVAQVLFALNGRYLINEKGAVQVAARLPLTVDNLSERAGSVWRAIGHGAFDAALAELGRIERELALLTEAAR
jgi:predicted nucleotidyltransferase